MGGLGLLAEEAQEGDPGHEHPPPDYLDGSSPRWAAS